MFKKSNFILLLILVSSFGYSQCTSTSGIAIINETFGSGASAIGPPLPAGVTNLQYLNTACPDDGQYSIVNYTSGCFSNAWYTTTDHTGDKNGYFMLVNASLQPSDFYVKTVNGLCEGTTYQFSSWVLNIDATNPTVLPNITFTIEKTDGTVLGTYTTGTIPYNSTGPVWKQYGMTFKTPPGVSAVVIRMHNNANGGIGNDLALDDISFTPAGPLTTISAAGFIGNTVNACTNSVNLTSAVGSCYVTNSYQWQQSTDGNSWTDIPGATNPNYSVSLQSTGTSFYRLSVAENGSIGSVTCRVNSNVITINDNYTSAVLKNVFQAICPGSIYVLPSGKAVSVAGIYLDTVFNASGCPGTITTLNLTIDPKPCLTPKIPNTFTPNGDGINDIWVIDDLQNFPQATVAIYSRWGMRLFYSIGYSKPWDGRYNGKDLPAGTYYYLINLNNGSVPLSGPVVIIR